jgi:ABC-type lipoprotein release transport system permease subunit
VSASNPWTLAAVVSLLALVTVVAADGPARRAGRVDPISILRGP